MTCLVVIDWRLIYVLMYYHVMSLCVDKAIALLVCKIFVDMLCHNLA